MGKWPLKYIASYSELPSNISAMQERMGKNTRHIKRFGEIQIENWDFGFKSPWIKLQPEIRIYIFSLGFPLFPLLSFCFFSGFILVLHFLHFFCLCRIRI